MSRWNGDPWLLAILLLCGAITVRARPGRIERLLAVAALGLAFLLFVSPFCALTSALFAARSAHHLLLTAALAPLVALAIPRTVAARMNPGLAFSTPAAAIILWLWHVPAFYAAALSSDALYWLMQASLGGTATAFWIGVRRSARPPAIAALLGYTVQMGLLGALLTFATGAWYAPHALTTSAWGLTPLEDQQIAGLIMWVIGSLVYLLAALVLTRDLVSDRPRAAVA